VSAAKTTTASTVSADFGPAGAIGRAKRRHQASAASLRSRRERQSGSTACVISGGDADTPDLTSGGLTDSICFAAFLGVKTVRKGMASPS